MGPRSPVPTPDGRQQCSQCGTFKPVADFEPTPRRACGITAMCRTCLKVCRRAGAELRRMQDSAYWRERADGPSPMTAPLSALLASDIALDDHA